MNRTDRMLAIILQLQAKKQQRAEDLAAHFEVSRRTIYRDIEALYQAGVPLIAQPGLGYSLDEGFFLPPLSFTPEEAMLVLLGTELTRMTFDAEYRDAAAAAAEKIRTVLPLPLENNVERLRENLMVNAPQNEQEAALLPRIRRAIAQRQRLRMVYQSRYGERDHIIARPEQRDLDPYKLIYAEAHWHVTGYCHLRQDHRIFRLTRISQLEVLPQTFIPMDMPSEKREMEKMGPDRLKIELLVAPEASAWIAEDRFLFITAREPHPEGTLVTLHVRHLEDIVQWLMGYARFVTIISPDELRERIAEEAQAILELQKRPESLLT
jgi:predicted DNA-binding transcriptional regulator YafY